LLDDGEEAKQRTGIITDTSKKKLKVKRPDLSKALWLMNTQYISDMTVPEHKGRSEKDWAKRKKEGEETDMGWRDPCEVQLESIERSFAAAQCAPIHDKNQDLHPVETMQVLPDFDRWPGSYVHFVYDEDPALDIKTLEGLDDAAKSAVLARSVVKPYSIASAGEGSVPEKFVALMLPAVPTAPAGTADNAEVEPIAPEEYQWIREYQYRQGVLSHLQFSIYSAQLKCPLCTTCNHTQVFGPHHTSPPLSQLNLSAIVCTCDHSITQFSHPLIHSEVLKLSY